jgi:hypothetical protein
LSFTVQWFNGEQHAGEGEDLLVVYGALLLVTVLFGLWNAGEFHWRYYITYGTINAVFAFIAL